MSRWNGYDEDGDLALDQAADRGEVETAIPCGACRKLTYEDERTEDGRCIHCEDWRGC